MRKLMYVIIAFNLIIFNVISFVSYSNQICYNILRDKSMIHISKPEDMSNSCFVDMIMQISIENKADILYRSIKNASYNRQEYIFYRTNNQIDFINIPTEVGNQAFVSSNIYLSTKNDYASKYIYGSSFFFDVTIYDFSKLRDSNLDRNIYYVSTDKIDDLIYSFQEKSIVSDKYFPEMTGFEELPVINIYQVLLVAFLLFSTVFFCFSRDKEIIIKKTAGYNSINILFEELKIHILSLFGIYIFEKSIFIIIILSLFYHSCFDYLTYSLHRDVTILLLLCIVMIFGSLYIIMQKNISYINGNSKNKCVYTFSIVIKIISTVVVIYFLSSLLSYFISISTAFVSMNNIKNHFSNYYTIAVNASNVDIEGNDDYYSENIENLYKYLIEIYNPIICYTGMYDMSGSQVLLLNNEYINFNPIVDSDMNVLNGYNCENCMLIPSTLSDSYIEKNHLMEMYYAIKGKNAHISIKKYSNKNNIFYTYKSESYTDNIGYTVNPIIIVCSDDELLPFASSIITGGNIIFSPLSNVTPREELYLLLQKYHLDNIILEMPKIEYLLAESISNLKLQAYRSGFESLMFLVILFVIIQFETTIYLQIYQKITAVKILNGYGMYAYIDAIFIDVIGIVICLIASNVLRSNIFVAGFISIMSMVSFLFIINKNQFMGIEQVLKGEI